MLSAGVMHGGRGESVRKTRNEQELDAVSGGDAWAGDDFEHLVSN